MWIARLSLVLVAAAVALLLLSGPGVRAGAWSFPTGFGMMRWAAYGGLAATALAVLASMVPRWRAGRGLLLGAVVALGLATAAVPWQNLRQARAVPPIHDISTDLEDPPRWVTLLPVREAAPNGFAHAGAELADQQRAAYPDIAPLELDAPAAVAFERAVVAAREMGWDIVDDDLSEGRIEATATSFWYGFKDDVVIRIRDIDGGSRVDVRSMSRVGRSDVGANAARIRAYLAKLKTAG